MLHPQSSSAIFIRNLHPQLIQVSSCWFTVRPVPTVAVHEATRPASQPQPHPQISPCSVRTSCRAINRFVSIFEAAAMATDKTVPSRPLLHCSLVLPPLRADNIGALLVALPLSYWSIYRCHILFHMTILGPLPYSLA